MQFSRVLAISAGLTAALSAFYACSSDPAPPAADAGVDDQNHGDPQAGSAGTGGTQTAGTAGGGTEGSGAGAAGTAQGGAGAGGTPAATYPAGPYGEMVGMTARDYDFVGLLHPKDAGYTITPQNQASIAFHDFYNPTGDAGKPRALVVTESALWCTYCKQQAEGANDEWTYWSARGAQFLDLVFEDVNYQPAQFTDLQTWAKTYHLEYPVATDPALQLGGFFDQSAAPFNMVIDLKTMTIVYAGTGAHSFGPGDATLTSILGDPK